MKKIYLDHSATTPVDKKVMDVMLPYFNNTFGNASSMHSFGAAALTGIDKAREQVAEYLNCEPGEVIFTGGATESDNLAIKGFIGALRDRGVEKMHIITSIVEHDAVLEPCMEMEKEGLEITYLPVKKNGAVDVEEFKKAIKENTVLVSVMWTNSEVGVMMPIREIGKVIKKYNEKRLKDWNNERPKTRGEKPRPIYFHTDATQAINFTQCDVAWNYVDMLSMSAHKIYGPKGVGALYIKKGVPMKSLQRGGHQEGNIRSGTYNSTGIIGLGAAISQLDKKNQEKNNQKIAKLRDLLVSEIKKNIPDAILNTDRNNSTPSHAHYSFPGAEGESVLLALDLEGIAVSTGSACSSGSLKASHVLIAMGIKKEIAHTSIRFTLGKHNTEAEIKTVVKKLAPIVARLRKMNPVYNK